MTSVSEAIVVEGRYDKNTISQVVDAMIIETNGFGIFSDAEKLDFLRRVAEKRGLIIMTDSDGAGFVIRNFLKGAIDPKLIKNAYIPDVPGKERRKAQPSGEGKIGVEGMHPGVILASLRAAGATMSDGAAAREKGSVTKADMYALGLSGTAGSRQRRLRLIKKLGLPERMSPNALNDAINVLMTKDELFELVNTL